MANIRSVTGIIILIVYSTTIFYSVSGKGLKNKLNKKVLKEIFGTKEKLQQVEAHLPDESNNRIQNETDVSRFKMFSKKVKERFSEECLYAHNKYRALHEVPLLSLNNELNEVSQTWANHLAKTKTFEHKLNNPYGENLYKFSTSKKITKLTMNGSEAVDAWYTQEIPYFTFGSEDVDYKKTGHFTQVVWAGSKYLGVGVAKEVGSNSIYVVCEYDPPGNYVGEYNVNVPPARLKH